MKKNIWNRNTTTKQTKKEKNFINLEKPLAIFISTQRKKQTNNVYIKDFSNDFPLLNKKKRRFTNGICGIVELFAREFQSFRSLLKQIKQNKKKNSKEN